MLHQEEKLCIRTNLRIILRKDSVLLWDTGETFVLSGSVFRMLAPLLDGTRSEDEIVMALSDRVPAAQLYHTLIKLRQRGLITGVVDDQAEGTSAFWHAYGADSSQVRDNRESTAVDLRVLHPAPRIGDQLRTFLVDNGVRIADSGTARLTVLVTDDYLRQDIDPSGLFDSDHPWLPVRILGDRVWVGPLLDQGARRSWTYLQRRLDQNERACLMLGLGTNRELRGPHPVSLPSLESLAPRFVATEVTKILLAGSTAVNGNVMVWDPVAGTVLYHPVPDPDTLEKLAGRRSLTDLGTAALVPRPMIFSADGGYRSVHPEHTWVNLEPFISPVTGIIPEIDRYATDSDIHVFTSKQCVSGTTFGASGKGKTVTQARVSCCAEALERHCTVFHGDEIRRTARQSELGEEAIAVEELAQFSEAQFAGREAWNREHDNANWVPAPYDDSAIEWTQATSLTHDHPRWVPASYCYMNYPGGDHPTFCRSNSNGCAAGNNLEEAILQGILELVERDAAAIWWYNRLQRPAVDLSGISDSLIASTIEYHERQGRDLVVLDISNDIGIPVMAGVSWDKDSGKDIYVSFGAHLDYGLAVSRALTELNQFAVLVHVYDDVVFRLLTPRERDYWVREANIDNQIYLQPNGEVSTADSCLSVNSTDLLQDIEHCIQVLGSRNIELLALDTTRAGSPLTVVRVIAPELRHFWARFRHGRLYDVPVQTGWLASPTAEASLNPTPMFF